LREQGIYGILQAWADEEAATASDYRNENLFGQKSVNKPFMPSDDLR
jgi:hypothetical protein